MKHLLGKALIILSMACSASFLHAQLSSSVVYGRTTIKLNQAFVGTFQGALITDLNLNPLQNDTIIFEATGGAVDLATTTGEVQHKGGLLINAGNGIVLRIQNFALDTTYPASPVITALFLLNGQYGARLPLFTVTRATIPTLPLVTHANVLKENGLKLTIAPDTATLINQLFGAGTLQAGVAAGSAETYLVLSPTN